MGMTSARRHGARLAALLLLVLGTTGRAQEGGGRVDERPLQVADDAFWVDMWANDDGIYDRAYDTTRSLLADGPRHVDLGRRTTVPLGVLHYTSTLQHILAPWDDTAIVVAARQDGLVLAGPAADLLPLGAVGPPPPGLTDDSGSMGYKRGLDLFERPGVPKEPGTWFVWFVQRDLVSNRVTVALEGGAQPAPAGGLGREPWPAPAAPRPSYAQGPASPALPAEPGIALATAKAAFIRPLAPPPEDDPDWDAEAAEAAAGPVAPLVLRGAARLRAPAPPPDATTGARAPRLVPITLVVTGTVDRGPLVVPLRVPETELQGEVSTAFFEVDLAAFPGIRLDAVQTLSIYAFGTDGCWTGPHTLTLVPEVDVGRPKPR